MKEVSQAKTGSRVKIKAAWVAGVNCCAHACTVKATAVPKIPVTRIVATTLEDGRRCGCSSSGVDTAVSTAATATCKKAICSKGKRSVDRPSKMMYKANAAAQPMVSRSPE